MYSDEFTEYLESFLNKGFDICSSILAKTELKRSAQRDGIDFDGIKELFKIVNLIELHDYDFYNAGELKTKNSKNLSSLDALHIISAQKEDIDFVITFDERQALVFEDLGYQVIKEVPNRGF
jgi:predicted nucleic acid-binding protein